MTSAALANWAPSASCRPTEKLIGGYLQRIGETLDGEPAWVPILVGFQRRENAQANPGPLTQLFSRDAKPLTTSSDDRANARQATLLRRGTSAPFTNHATKPMRHMTCCQAHVPVRTFRSHPVTCAAFGPNLTPSVVVMNRQTLQIGYAASSMLAGA